MCASCTGSVTVTVCFLPPSLTVMVYVHIRCSGARSSMLRRQSEKVDVLHQLTQLASLRRAEIVHLDRHRSTQARKVGESPPIENVICIPFSFAVALAQAANKATTMACTRRIAFFLIILQPAMTRPPNAVPICKTHAAASKTGCWAIGAATS